MHKRWVRKHFAPQVAYMSAFPSAPLAHVFLCLYDTAVVFLEACQALVKYGLHVSERWHAAQAERVRTCFSAQACTCLAA